MKKIESGAISGFPEFLPEEQIKLNLLIKIAREGFERYGFLPVETCAIERKEVLNAKDESEKEIFFLHRHERSSGKVVNTDYALHFDLTIPLARYIATHESRLVFPFRRYQIQKVWRGEKPQEGRYHEFYQCDIDIIGKDKLSYLADAELPLIISDIFNEMKIGRFLIGLNNVKLLRGYLEKFGIPPEKEKAVIKLISKRERIGMEQVLFGLNQLAGLSQSSGSEMMSFFKRHSSVEEQLLFLGKMEIGRLFHQGLRELTEVIEGMRMLGVKESHFCIDLGMARGFNYYTGTIFETVLVDHPGIGGICSGGRYDDLTGFFTNGNYPGVGISIGLTRLFKKLLRAGVIKPQKPSIVPVVVTVVERTALPFYVNLTKNIRAAGVAAELFFEEAELGKQLRYGDQKGFRLAIIAGHKEINEGVVQIKDLRFGDRYLCNIDELPMRVSEIIEQK